MCVTELDCVNYPSVFLRCGKMFKFINSALNYTGFLYRSIDMWKLIPVYNKIK